MEGKLYGKWNAIGANGIRVNGKSGVPLTSPPPLECGNPKHGGPSGETGVRL